VREGVSDMIGDGILVRALKLKRGFWSRLTDSALPLFPGSFFLKSSNLIKSTIYKLLNGNSQF